MPPKPGNIQEKSITDNEDEEYENPLATSFNDIYNSLFSTKKEPKPEEPKSEEVKKREKTEEELKSGKTIISSDANKIALAAMTLKDIETESGMLHDPSELLLVDSRQYYENKKQENLTNFIEQTKAQSKLFETAKTKAQDKWKEMFTQIRGYSKDLPRDKIKKACDIYMKLTYKNELDIINLRYPFLKNDLDNNDLEYPL